MTLSVQLPVALEQKLSAYCATHHLTEDEAIQEALKSLLAQDSPIPTPYERGRDGFGADHVHSGDIARESKQLLRMKFRGSSSEGGIASMGCAGWLARLAATGR